MVTGSLRGRLWSDEPSEIDYLAARAIAETVTDAVLDDSLDPLAIGLSGPWGSGKTTVLRLVEAELGDRSDPDHTVLVIRSDPWRYDPAVGAKESVIGDVHRHRDLPGPLLAVHRHGPRLRLTPRRT